MAVTTEKVLTFASPFILAALLALGGWVDRIEQRQYDQINSMASKAELKETSQQLNDTLNLFIRSYEKQRAEDRESFGQAINRIERRQLESSNKIDQLMVSISQVAVIAQLNKEDLARP